MNETGQQPSPSPESERAVLLIGPYPPPFGGPGVHMMHLRRRLLERGVTCDVLNIGENRRRRLPGITPVDSGPGFVASVARFARRGHHVHHFFNVESYKAIILATLAATVARALGTTYSVGFIGGPRQRYLIDTGSMWSKLCRIPLHLAEFTICNNEAVRNALSVLCGGRSRVYPIQCFFDRQIADVGDPPQEVQRFVRGRSPVLSSVTSARFETDDPYHELKTLLGAVRGLRRKHPDIGCVVIGGNRKNLETVYERLVEEAALLRHFLFSFELPHDQCLGVIKCSDVFVRAYVKDGNSSSVREALALQVPTVAAANPHHPAGVVPFEPNSGDDLATRLTSVVERYSEHVRQLAALPAGASIDREIELLLNPTARSAPGAKERPAVSGAGRQGRLRAVGGPDRGHKGGGP